MNSKTAKQMIIHAKYSRFVSNGRSISKPDKFGIFANPPNRFLHNGKTSFELLQWNAPLICFQNFSEFLPKLVDQMASATTERAFHDQKLAYDLINAEDSEEVLSLLRRTFFKVSWNLGLLCMQILKLNHFEGWTVKLLRSTWRMPGLGGLLHKHNSARLLLQSCEFQWKDYRSCFEWHCQKTSKLSYLVFPIRNDEFSF